jgi:2-dehydropantoate 2-reductase
MKTIVIGAGGMGSVIAAHLARAGEDVVVLARGTRAQQVRASGISIRGLTEFTVRVTVAERPEELDKADFLILTVKTFDTAPALAGLRHLDVGAALSLQNGVMKNDTLSEVFGPEHTLGCTAEFSAELTSDGPVLFTVNNGLYIGELPSGSSSRVEGLAETLTSSGVKAIASEDVRAKEWAKYVGWLAVAAIAVLTRLPVHAVLNNQYLASLCVDLVKEGCDLAKALGVEHVDDLATSPVGSLARMPTEEAVASLRTIGATMEERGFTNQRVSALQDAERGRRLEIEETFGYMIKTAAERGVAVPTMATCYQLLAGLDASFSH